MVMCVKFVDAISRMKAVVILVPVTTVVVKMEILYNPTILKREGEDDNRTRD
ncbi:MAG TPA: hypothetical protein VI489_05000 [Candidatus Brocadiaceae bacterium]